MCGKNAQIKSTNVRCEERYEEQDITVKKKKKKKKKKMKEKNSRHEYGTAWLHKIGEENTLNLPFWLISGVNST